MVDPLQLYRSYQEEYDWLWERMVATREVCLRGATLRLDCPALLLRMVYLCNDFQGEQPLASIYTRLNASVKHQIIYIVAMSKT